MRRGIETAPRDGQNVILEDDTKEGYELAHWSIPEGAWVGQNGKPFDFTPSYWIAMHRTEQSASLEEAKSRFDLMPGTEVPLISYRAGQPLAEETGSDGGELRRVLSIAKLGEPQKSFTAPNNVPLVTPKSSADLVPPLDQKIIDDRYFRPPPNRRSAYSAIGAAMVLASLMGICFRAQFGAYVRQHAPPIDSLNVATSEGQPISDAPQRQTEAQPRPQESDPERRQTLEAEQRAAMAASQQTLQQRENRLLALENELAKVRQDFETRTANASKVINDAAQSKQTVKIAEELRQALRQEREKSRALEDQLARSDVDQTTLSRKTGDETRSGQVAEKSTAVERDGATQQRNQSEQFSNSPTGPTDALATGWFGRDVQDRSNDQKAARTEAAAAGQLGRAEGRGATLLVESADALLARRYFGAARGVLTRAAATGNPEAIFKLAETYDPLILSAWKATRTRGDVKKARELYDKAYEGGVKKARDRSNALR